VSPAGGRRYSVRMTCPHCGARDQAGKFCAECGEGLRAECPECGAELESDARFCAACGARVGGGGRSRAPWWIVAAAALVVILILLIPERAERAGPIRAVDPGAGAPVGPPMGFTGDMRIDADRLFNRVMAAAEQRRMEEVNQFLPMAIQAYEAVPDLDHDGLFHLAILYQTAGSHGMAQSTAEEILRDSPNHVLALGVAGSSAAEVGDSDTATAYFRRLVEGYPTEIGRPLAEYMDHRTMLEEYHRIARDFLADSS
jgi:tetratricopeptide (TPR) repeat protein